MAVAPDGRIFVAQQGGAVRIIKNGSLLSTPFATVTVNSQNERGLGGIVLDPSFASNGYVYVYYTATTPILHNRVARFTANGDVAVAGSHTTILDLPDLIGAINHMGGAMHFGADGKLYIAVGNHDLIASGPQQSIDNVYGKFLRINKDGSIPTDNPFYNQASGINRSIYGYGLRNPFTFAIQPGTGRIFINDVGQDSWEEINEGVAGANYGWPLSEGATSNPAFTSPFYAYPASQGCAITGGAFYNPATAQFPSSYVGKYFFLDLCGGWIKTLDTATKAVANFASGLSSPVDLDVAGDGTMYYIQRGNNSVRKITHAPIGPPVITSHPQSQTVDVGEPVTFTVAATGQQPLSYSWQRNGVTIPGATSSSFTISSPTMDDNADVFRAVVTNSVNSVTSNGATLTVENNEQPVANIVTPAAGTTFAHGQTISYSGTGAEFDGDPLPASAFTWQVDYYTNGVQRPFIPATSGAVSGSFVIPTTSPYTGTDVYYRVMLTVTDANDNSHTVWRDLQPQVSTVTLATNPPGLQLRLDGQPVSTPHVFQGVEGLERNIEAPSPQSGGGTTYNFNTWSDGGAAAHNISTPTSNTTYTATFTPVASTTVYLSDLNPTFAQNGSGPYERDTSNGELAAGDGNPIRLNGVTYTKGLGVHAYSELRYNLAGGGYDRFLASVGVDDEVNNSGSVVFQVWAGGTKLYDSGTMGGATATKNVDVSIAGQSEIRLIVTDSGNGDAYDHADWAMARITRPVPSVVSSGFLFETRPHRLQFRFDLNVAASLSASDLLLENLTTGQAVPAAMINTPTYDTATNTATFTFGYPNGVLPDGDYRATLAASGIATAAGVQMAADHVYTFFHLTADASRDRRVDSADFDILASNFGLPANSFAQGDFNYDNWVNSHDFNILASLFGTDLDDGA